MNATYQHRWIMSWMIVALCFCAGGLMIGTVGCVPMTPVDNGSTDDGSSDDGSSDGSGDSSDGSGIEDIDDGSGGTDGSDSGSDGGDSGSGDDGGSDGSSDGGDDGSDGGDSGSDGGDSGSDGDTPDDSTAPSPTAVTLEELVKTGDGVPNQSGATFTQFGDPVIDADGRIAFWAQYTGGNGSGGLYVWENGTIRRVVHDDPNETGVVPGRTTADYFGTFDDASILEFDLAWGGGDRLLFVSNIAGEKVSRGIYRWRATDGDMVRVVDLEMFDDLFPDASPNALDPTFTAPGVTDGGLAVFACDYLYISQSASFVTGKGVYTSNGTTLSVLVDSVLGPQTTGNVPDQAGSTYFDLPWLLTTVNGTDVLYQGGYKAGSGDYGVYMRRGSTSYRVIDNRTGRTWSGLDAGTQFYPEDAYPRLAIGPNGHIAIDSQLLIDGNARDVVIVWDPDAGQWRSYTGPNGTPATDLVSGVNDEGRVLLLSGGMAYIVRQSDVANVFSSLSSEFSGVNLTWADNGGAINNSGHAVVPYTRDDQRCLAFYTGAETLMVADPVAGLPSGATEISTVLEPENDRPGRSGMLNDDDVMVFRVIEGGNQQAIYRGVAQ